MMNMKISYGFNPVEGHARISNCSPGSSQLSKFVVRPGGRLDFRVLVQFGQTRGINSSPVSRNRSMSALFKGVQRTLFVMPQFGQIHWDVCTRESFS